MYVNEDGVRLTEIPPDYSDGMTKQSFKDQTDINKIIKKAQVSGGLSHAMKYDEAVYGEFTGVDLLGAHLQVEKAKQIFADLPSEVRREFDQDAFKFAEFASDPKNIGRLAQLIPAIAAPGDFRFPQPGDEPPPNRTEEVQAARKAAAEGAPEEAPPETPPAKPEPQEAGPASSST